MFSCRHLALAERYGQLIGSRKQLAEWPRNAIQTYEIYIFTSCHLFAHTTLCTLTSLDAINRLGSERLAGLPQKAPEGCSHMAGYLHANQFTAKGASPPTVEAIDAIFAQFS